MPQEVVTADIARAIRRTPGSTVTFINQGATDVYFDSNPGRLNASAPGSVPSGTKIANTGGQIQFASYPDNGVVWVRAATQTTLEVQP